MSIEIPKILENCDYHVCIARECKHGTQSECNSALRVFEEQLLIAIGRHSYQCRPLHNDTSDEEPDEFELLEQRAKEEDDNPFLQD